jgi:hypothetical protein
MLATGEKFLRSSPLNVNYRFTSKRLDDDQRPGVPSAAFARTRHHIFVTGRVEVENCDAVLVWFTI